MRARSAARRPSASRGDAWTAEEIDQLRSLSLSELEPLPADPSNRVADDPRAIKFGQRLFFDTRLSSNGKVSCATCHIPNRGFQDDKPLANGVGMTGRRTMPIAGTAYAPFLFWDGRKDSLWSQALTLASRHDATPNPLLGAARNCRVRVAAFQVEGHRSAARTASIVGSLRHW